jgi:hypothetical protein
VDESKGLLRGLESRVITVQEMPANGAYAFDVRADLMLKGNLE